MAITFDGQNDRISTTSQGLTVPQNVSGTFQAGGLAIGAGSTILVTNSEGRVAIGTATFPSTPFRTSLVVNGAIESLRDGAGEGGQLVLRGQAGNIYRWNIDNHYTGSLSQLRVFREDDVTTANGISYFTVDQAGRVSMPFQPVFYAYQTGAASGTALGAFTTQFNTTLINTGSCYSTSTGRFTAPISGTYRFEARMLARQQGTNGSLEFTFYKNGSNIVGRSSCYTYVVGAIDHDNMYASVFLTLSQNDYVQVGFTVVNAGTDYYYGENLASFSGQLIG